MYRSELIPIILNFSGWDFPLYCAVLYGVYWVACFIAQLNVGDLVQARWEDGRMYFGQVQQLYEGEQECVYI